MRKERFDKLYEEVKELVFAEYPTPKMAYDELSSRSSFGCFLAVSNINDVDMDVHERCTLHHFILEDIKDASNFETSAFNIARESLIHHLFSIPCIYDRYCWGDYFSSSLPYEYLLTLYPALTCRVIDRVINSLILDEELRDKYYELRN